MTPTGKDAELSAHVWARFPDCACGHFAEWIFRHVLNGPERDYEHAMRELRRIQSRIEEACAPRPPARASRPLSFAEAEAHARRAREN